MLLRRATALSCRQRAGKGAPPSPGRLVFRNTGPEFVAPVLTPAAIPRALSPAIDAGVPTKLPPSLLAPRYAHLHEEVITVSSPELPTVASKPSTAEIDTPDSQIRPVESQEPEFVAPVLAPTAIPRALSPATEAGVPTKLSPSFLAPRYAHLHEEVITVSSPELPTVASRPSTAEIDTAETQLSPKPSQFPKAKSAKEMVHLNHVEPPRSVQRPRTVSGPIIIPGRTRKDSGGSVKDLIESFETVQKNAEEEMKRSNSRLVVRKVASMGNFNARPRWRP